MRAIADQLREKFDGIHIVRDFVRLGKSKFPASEFALRSVRIGDVTIDIDEAVRKNPQAQMNEALRTYVGGREVNGVRLPRKRKMSEEDGDVAVDNRHNRHGPRRQQERRDPARPTTTLPALDGISEGGVRFFNRGHAAHGGGHGRDNVMRVSRLDLIRGQPSYLF
jgi:hypothetical protein